MQIIHPLEKQGCAEAFKTPWFYLLLGTFSAWSYMHFGPSVQMGISLLFAFFLILMSLVDLKHMILPDVLVLPCLLLGVVLAPYYGSSYLDANIGASIGFGLFYLIHIGFYKLKGYHGLGFGDVKLLAMLGAWAGAMQIPLILLLASFTGIFAFILRRVFLGVQGNTPLPFGPFLATGGWLCYLYASELWYAFLKFRESIVTALIGG